MPTPYGFDTTATEVANDFSSNIRGKAVLVTGVTPNSLGSHFVETIAAHSPSLIILASRTQAAMDITAAAIRARSADVPIETVVVDLGSLASVRKAAAAVLALKARIDVLVLNAGLMASPYSKTVDGFESQFGICHLGHFVFGNTIIPSMLGPGLRPRVVVVSSEGHQLGPVRFTDPGFTDGQEYDKWRAYGQAKTANNLYAWSLAENLGPKGLESYSLHPGGIMTNLVKHIDMQSGDDVPKMLEVYRSVGSPLGFPEHMKSLKFKSHDQGTATHIVAAFADDFDANDNGKYLIDGQIATWDKVGPWARNSYDAERLWKISEDMVGETYAF
ncbi:WW domain-containing oxidoreductase [Paraphoma chrysanthemicola]|nr:WW domain-containing oxidoreductase [Paraphoma chrysanthemicola]